LVFSILGYAPVLDHWGWHVTYTSNFSQAFIEGDYGHSRHLWSLCVEEQFYLFWPFIVIFTPRRHLPRVIVCLILGAVLYRFGGSLAGLDWKQATRPLLGCVDSLGFGALLAVYWCDPDKYAKQSALLLRLSLWLGLPLLVGTQTLYALSPSPRGLTVYVALVDLSSSLFFVYLLHNAAMNKQHLFGRLLALSPVRYVGKISYGIYLYHFFLIDVLWSLSTRLNVQIPTGWPYFLVHVAATILVAAVSWHVIEKPINNLKNRIPY
ncbi:MAG: acyltransferase, partial [Planctomycetota bacterium]